MNNISLNNTIKPRWPGSQGRTWRERKPWWWWQWLVWLLFFLRWRAVSPRAYEDVCLLWKMLALMTVKIRAPKKQTWKVLEFLMAMREVIELREMFAMEIWGLKDDLKQSPHFLGENQRFKGSDVTYSITQIFNDEDQLEPKSFLLTINKWEYLFKKINITQWLLQRSILSKCPLWPSRLQPRAHHFNLWLMLISNE